ncbi:MAG: hypothetical protein HQK53_12955 [Oligoflexia bacterium]|nr:hypothetical protein [Oligoflexia bacterium]
MNKLQILSVKIADPKKTGRKTIPLSLKEEVVRVIQIYSLGINLNVTSKIFYDEIYP